MSDTFPPSDPEAAELSTCGDEEEEGIHLGEEMDEDFTVQLGATYSCRKADSTYHEAEVVKMRTNKRAKREEYMVRYVGMTRRQTEWVDKSRLVLLNPPEEEIVEEGSEQEMSENGQTLQSDKPDEDEPETKKPKVESNESVDPSTLKVPGDFAEELTCLLCSKLYEDPVMVECGHNFCRRCVDKTWADQDFFTCPDCKEVQTEKSYCTNRALGRLVKKAAGIPVEAPIPFKNCDDHEEQVRFYCKEDGTLSCVICQDSLKHANHTFLPIPEAVEMYRAQLPGLINPMEEALTKTEELAAQYREHIEQHQSKVTEYKQQVTTEFANLYGFLKDRKESLLEQLRTQGQDVVKEIEANSAQLVVNRDNLRQVIADAHEKLEDTNTYSFLPGIKPLFKRLKEQKKAALTTRNTLSDKELCHGMFNGPLQYITWRQMKSVIGPIPETDDSTHSKKRKTSIKTDSSVGSSKDAVKKSDQKGKPESGGDQEAAAQELEIPVEDFSDLINKAHKEIWITGDGYVSATRHYVEKGPYANNLLFPKSVCNIQWLTNSKVWSGVLTKLKKAAKTYKKPNVIFIHMGNFELGRRGFDSLNSSISKVLDGISGLFQGVEIILSTVLPKRDWLGTPVENHRKSFNATLRRYAGKRRFQVVKHDDLERALFERLRRGPGEEAEGFLTDSECGLFLKSMREALLKDLKGRKRPYESTKEPERSNKTEPMRHDVQSPSPRQRGVLFSKEPQTIWIIGNMYIYKAYGHVGKRPYGPHLGFKEFNWNLRWLGRTTRWDKMLPDLQKSIGTQSMPSALFIHLGSDDLELTSYEGLIEDMRTSLGQLIKMYPKVKIVLSAVLPKAEWMGSHLDGWRKMFNTRLDRYATRHRFPMVKYDLLEQRMAARFKKDGDSDLTADENEAFVAGIKDSVLKAMLKGVPPAAKNLQKQERKSVEVREGSSIRSSDEKRQRTLSSTDKESDANASITESEKLEASMEVDESTPSSDISPNQKLIFIAGDAIVTKISGLAEKIPYGASLGFEEDKWNVRWIGKIMKWTNVIPALKKYSGPKTSAIYLHLGSMDLGRNRTNFSVFFGEVRHALSRLAWLFPKAQIVLSSVFPRVQWMADNREQSRKKFNEKLLDFANKQGFEYVGHKVVEEKLLARFKRGDPSSLLSEEEMEEFVKDVKDALQKAVEKGDRQPVEKPPPEIEDFDVSELDKPDEEYEEPPIDPDNLPERNLWIIGSPFIRAVHMEALNSPSGQNLGLEKRNWTLQWMDNIVSWGELIPKMRESSQILGEPSAVFIHLGNNDLGQYGMKKLIGNVRSYLGQLSNTFPKTQFIFSPILPKAEWLGKSQEGCRKKFNNSIAIFARKCGLDVLSHDKLEKMRLVRFKSGNYSVALSPSEMEVFTKTLRISLLKAMFKEPNAASGSFFVPLGSREPQEVVLSSGATLYFVPDIEERRKFNKEFDEEEHMKIWKAANKKPSSDRDESDQSESDRSDSDEDTDRENSDQEDEEKDREEADQEKEKGTDGEKVSDVCEEADQNKEKMDADEGKDTVQEGEEQDAEVKGTDEGGSALREGAGQDEEKMECDPPATLPTMDSALDQPENPTVEEKSGPGQVWLIGSSFLCRAKQYAQSKPYWNNLGLDEQNVAVHWMGYIGMRWEALAEEVEKARSELGIPNVIIMHLGGNDMGRMPYKQFFKAVKYDLRRFATRFRKTHFIFSSILPRTEWLMTPVEQVRMKFNRVIVKCSWNLSCHVLVHNNFEDKVIARFKTGRSNDLSDMEYHLLLTSIKDSVQKVLSV